MKKVCVLYGSPRKGNTAAAAQVVLEELRRQGDVEITEFDLAREGPGFCLGCYRCIRGQEEKCPHRDRMEPILRAMQEADGLFFAAPVYVMDVPAQLKAFLDHLGYIYMIHRPMGEMFRKSALILSTAAGGGTKDAMGAIDRSLSYWGVPCRRKLGINIWANGWAGIPPKRKAKLEAALQSKARQFWKDMERRPMPGLKTRLMFAFMGRGAASFEGADGEYWKEKGWLTGKRPWED